MALDELQAVIESLQSKIESYRAHLSENETRTRQVLIDPLLKELGWDVSDPDQVELEYSAGGGRADYALMSEGKPVAVIEAKRLGYKLDQNETLQVLNYANSRGIAHMAVTNGDEWRMYDVFAQKPIEDRVIMEFSITHTPAHESALQSLRIWNPNVSSGSGPVGASESIVKTVSDPELLTRTQVETAYSDESSSTQLGQREDQSQGRVQSDHGADLKEADWIRLTRADKHPKWESSVPKRIRFENSEEVELKSGIDLVDQVILWIWDKRPSTGDWLGFSSKHGAKPFTTSHGPHQLTLEPGLYFDKDNYYHKPNRWLLTQELLYYFDYDPKDVYVKFD